MFGDIPLSALANPHSPRRVAVEKRHCLVEAVFLFRQLKRRREVRMYAFIEALCGVGVPYRKVQAREHARPESLSFRPCVPCCAQVVLNGLPSEMLFGTVVSVVLVAPPTCRGEVRMLHPKGFDIRVFKSAELRECIRNRQCPLV